MQPKSPSFSLSKANKGLKFSINNEVGPGQYHPQIVSKAIPYTMSKSPRDSKPNNIPGPGNYEIKPNLTHNQSPSITLTKEPKAELFRINKNPGPGKYDVAYEKVKKSVANHYTFGKCAKTIAITLTPGPGDYNTTVLSTGNKIGMGKSPKNFYITEGRCAAPCPALPRHAA